MMLRWGRAVAPVVMILLVASVVVAAAPAATAAGDPGGIAVETTMWATGEPASGGCVEAYDAAGMRAGSDCVGEAGRYTVPGLADGEYRLSFVGFGGAPTQWYDRGSSLAQATPVTVAGGIAEMAYALLPPLSISGRVTDGTGAPIGGVPVTAAAAYAPVVTGSTAEDGRYVVVAAKSGFYRVRFDAPAGLASEAWPDDAVTQGRLSYLTTLVTGHDVTLEPGGALGGAILPPPGVVAPGSEACVHLYDYAAYGDLIATDCGPVGAPFEFADLHAGGYVLCVQAASATTPCGSSGTGWFGGDFASGHSDARQVTVVAGVTTPVSLAWGGTLKVSVRLDNGAPLAGGCLAPGALASAGAVEDCDPVDGVFTFTLATDHTRDTDVTLTRAANAPDQSLFLRQHVVAGDTVDVTVMAASMGLASATVAVARDDGRPITAGCVDARLRGVAGTVTKGTDCTIRSDGVAEFAGLPDGDYTFRVRGVPGSYDVVTYPAAVNSEAGTVLSLAGGEHVDVAMTMPTTQQVTGSVLDPDGAPLAGRAVALVNSTGVVASAVTDGDGAYSIVAPVVAARLMARGGDGYAPRWHWLASTYSSGTTLTGPSKAAALGPIALRLSRASTMTGTIAAPDTITATEVCVMAIEFGAPFEVARDCGAVGDAFTLTGLGGASYRLCVAAAPASGGCFDPSAPGAISGGTALTVPYSVPSAGVGAVTLAFGGTVAVAVTDASGVPLGGGCADVRDGSTVVASSCDNDAGVITVAVGRDVTGADPTVVVRDVPGMLDSSPRSVQRIRGGQTQSVTVAMVVTPVIEGTVTRPGDAGRVCVIAATAAGADVAETCLDSGQTGYRLEVPAGTYTVTAWPDSLVQQAASVERVTTSSGSIGRADLILEAAGVIAVAPEVDSAPVTGGCALIFTVELDLVDGACDPSEDGYVVGGLAPGSYLILLSGFDGAADAWLGGGWESADATRVAVTADQVTRISAPMRAGAGLSGTTTGVPAVSSGGAWAELLTIDGDFVGWVPLETDGSYDFGNVPAGTYRVFFASEWPGFSGGWARLPGEIAPRTVTIAPGAPVTDANRAITWADGRVEIYGEMNVPSDFRSSTVCAVAVDGAGAAIASDCVPRGAEFSLEPVYEGAAVRVAFTDGAVRTAGQWKAFTGKVRWYGNVAAASAPTAPTGPSLYNWLPVYFFSDVTTATKGWWAIQWMGASGLSTGYADGTYQPTADVTRRHMAAFLYRLAGQPTVAMPARSPYPDVDPSMAGYRAVVWMDQEGITTGYEDGTFGQGDPVTRKQMAMFLHRMAGSPSPDGFPPLMFHDVSTSMSGYTAVRWMYETGITTGYGDGSFRPNQPVTRKEMAQFLYRYAAWLSEHEV